MIGARGGLEGKWSSVRGGLQRNWWTLGRFGLTPHKVLARVCPGDAPTVLCVSIPKAGTHLLERALCLHPALYRRLVPTISGENIDRHGGLSSLLSRLRPGQVILSHLRYAPELRDTTFRQGTRGLFLVRDPHDIVVSEAFYLSRDRRHRHHALFASLPSEKERIRLAITGDRARDVISIGRRLRYFAGWLDSGFMVVRFEELVGPAGGGSDTAQSAALRSIFNHLGVEASPAQVERIATRLFSNRSPTFRRGMIGAWQDHFDPELQRLFDEVVGDELSRLGYAS